MMQEKFDEENNRSSNYTKIDERCQDNIPIDHDESYRQILHFNEHVPSKQDRQMTITVTSQLQWILFLILMLIPQSNAIPIQRNYNSQSVLPRGVSYPQQPPSSLPVAMVQLTDRTDYSPQAYKTYRRFPNTNQAQANSIPSYSNGAVVRVYDQTNFQSPPQQSSVLVQTPNVQQLTLQLRRERQRRAMIDRILLLFDEDRNGQLTKEELYTMSLRTNMFPKIHSYLKQISQPD